MKAVLFLVLYKQLCCPRPCTNTHTLPRVLQRGGHSVLAISTNSIVLDSARLIQRDSLRMIHPPCAQPLAQGWCLQGGYRRGSLRLLLLRCELPGGACYCPLSDRVVSRTETLADEAHGAVTPNNGIPQLSAYSDSVHVSSSCWAASHRPPARRCSTCEKTASLCRHSVWHKERTIHIKAQPFPIEHLLHRDVFWLDYMITLVYFSVNYKQSPWVGAIFAV